MKIAILGTGMVGRVHAKKLTELGHDVMIGTNDVKRTLEKSKSDVWGNPPFSEWHKMNSKIKINTFSEAASHGEIVINALKGVACLDVLKKLKHNLNGKILIDISNPLDFSKGMPPTLFICNNDSLGEQIQYALPNVKVVKTFNTVNAMLQTNPKKLYEAEHHIFLSGNDKDAKERVTEIIKKWYGWKHIIDLGDITTSRSTEMFTSLWLSLSEALKTPSFNIKIIYKTRKN
jgi:predicted dinucleotide-binding enzyme